MTKPPSAETRPIPQPTATGNPAVVPAGAKAFVAGERKAAGKGKKLNAGEER